jgi:flagellar biogenesis protein FliO
MDFDTLILGVATLLFVVALFALLVWAFRTFFGKASSASLRKAREKRLGVIETVAVDSKRTLYLVRRDDAEGPSTWWWRRESKAVRIRSIRPMTT